MDTFTIQNLVNAEDAFEEADEGYSNRVTVSIQQRNGRKSTTLVEGLDPEFNFKKILKYMRKNFRCNGAVVKSAEGEEIILLQGNQGDNVISFMVDMNICKKEQIIRKGI